MHVQGESLKTGAVFLRKGFSTPRLCGETRTYAVETGLDLATEALLDRGGPSPLAALAIRDPRIVDVERWRAIGAWGAT